MSIAKQMEDDSKYIHDFGSKEGEGFRFQVNVPTARLS
jgi:hypothetical protein